jgi:hypothetical protein
VTASFIVIPKMNWERFNRLVPNHLAVFACDEHLDTVKGFCVDPVVKDNSDPQMVCTVCQVKARSKRSKSLSVKS